MARQATRCSNQPMGRIRYAGRLLGWLLLGGSTAWGSQRIRAWLQDAQRWPLSEWHIEGRLQQTSQQQIWQVLQALQPLQSFMCQDLRILQQQVEQLPWIAHAQVRKQWPNRLLLHCVEHQAVARWQARQLLNQQGQPFSAPLAPSIARQLPQLAGPQGSEQQLLATWRAMERQVAPHGLRITALRLNRRQAWQLTVNGSIHCQLGRQDPALGMARFLVLYPLLIKRPVAMKATGEALHRRVDLRYDQGAAVRWDTPPAPTDE